MKQIETFMRGLFSRTGFQNLADGIGYILID